MPSKKKYNARFAPARIKKIMQSDEEVGKVSAAVPIIISKALEMFLDSLLETADDLTRERTAKTLTLQHLKQCIMTDKKYDFLNDLVANIPDLGPEEEEEEMKEKIPRKRRRPTTTERPNGSGVTELLCESASKMPEAVVAPEASHPAGSSSSQNGSTPAQDQESLPQSAQDQDSLPQSAQDQESLPPQDQDSLPQSSNQTVQQDAAVPNVDIFPNLPGCSGKGGVS